MRTAVALLVLAVFLCLTLPMTSGDMGGSTSMAAFVCCFILATSLGVFLLMRPEMILIRSVPTCPQGLNPRGDPFVRLPDINTLGVLLI